MWNDRDFWQRRRYHQDPIEILAKAGAQAIINLSASPFTVGKQLLREQMLGHIAEKYSLPLAYVNQVGGNDDLIFDGRSGVWDARGRLFARAKGFQEDVVVADLARGTGEVAEDDFEAEAEVWNALVLGVRDYARKTGFTKVLLGLSGRDRFGADGGHRRGCHGSRKRSGSDDALVLLEPGQRRGLGGAGAQPGDTHAEAADFRSDEVL